MSLRDTACYTLTVVNSTREPGVVELGEASSSRREEARYARVREKREKEAYSSVLYGTSLVVSRSAIGRQSGFFKKILTDLYL
jgi:hypothetical protein